MLSIIRAGLLLLFDNAIFNSNQYQFIHLNLIQVRVEDVGGLTYMKTFYLPAILHKKYFDIKAVHLVQHGSKTIQCPFADIYAFLIQQLSFRIVWQRFKG
ncbi:MAG TPA: hypothetical protein VEV83_04895 [Parafilimonas sp.]|nr:hypothetical protein [Parafilimonas sp.]